jgi:folate-dependent phosphoribosylglycinamide formyltransferase PurN
VRSGDTEAALAARVLEVEHRIYPQALRWVAEAACGSPMAAA